MRRSSKSKPLTGPRGATARHVSLVLASLLAGTLTLSAAPAGAQVPIAAPPAAPQSQPRVPAPEGLVKLPAAAPATCEWRQHPAIRKPLLVCQDDDGAWFVPRIYAGFNSSTIERAARNDPDAMVDLAIFYRLAPEGARDPQRSFALLKAAAAQGGARAMEMLGEAYRDGVGVAEDPKEAAKWFRAASDRGNVNAMAALATMSNSFPGWPEDPAVKWPLLRRAAEGGNAFAAEELFVAYARGAPGIVADRSQAVHWLRKAADNGSPLAMEALADLYTEGGDLVGPDPAEAEHWRSAAQVARRTGDPAWLARQATSTTP